MRAQGKGMPVVFAVTLVVSLFALPSLADKKPSVQGKVNLEGVITAIDGLASAFLLRVTKHGSGTTLILVQGATDLVGKRHKGHDEDRGENEGNDDQEEHARQRVAITDFRVGDEVKVQGFRLDDGRVVALRVDVRNRAVPVHPPLALPSVVAQGVVTSRSLSTLSVLGATGGARVVLVAPGTRVTGQRSSATAIIPDDVVRVDGVLNTDGSVTARQIDVVFATGYQVTGRITQKGANGQFLILDNRFAVNIASDTRVISRGQARSFSDLQVGQSVTAVGTPITVAGFTIGENAKVILF